MRRIVILATALILPMTFMFIACGITGYYFFLIHALIQFSLFITAVQLERTWWTAYGLGLLGIMCGHACRIMYDSINHQYDHNLFPIELALSAALSAIFMIPGMIFVHIIRSNIAKDDEIR
jgi:hypothetical protein